jgi:rifampicin phosphotransferase
MDDPYDAEADEAEFEAWRTGRIAELRARLDGRALAEFDHWLALAEQAYPLNENHNYLLGELPFGLVRYAALETGRRFAAAGRIDEVGDVFFMRGLELAASLRARDDLHGLIAQRRAEWERNAQLAPPPVLGPPPAEPPYHVFPDAVGDALRAVLGQAAQLEGRPARESTDDTVVGLPGGPGSAEGPVRVVRSIDEFDKVENGDILVCSYTNPAWTVLFPRVVGLVADSGGPLSHAAIVAREYGLPSVVGTLDATRRLEDGQRVRIDGAAGTVTILAPAEREAVCA